MKKNNLVWGAALALLLPVNVLVSCSDDEDNNGYDDVPVVNPESPIDNAPLSNKVLRNLCKNNQNTMYSPVSMNFLLGMITNGVDSVTQAKTLNTMGLPKTSMEEANAYYLDIMNKLNSDNDPKAVFSCVNAMWADQNVVVKPNFIFELEKSYKAAYAQLDFSSSTANDAIDEWANTATKGLIKNLNLNLDNASVVVANACCFLADWTEPFEGQYKGEFKNGDGSINKNAHKLNKIETMSYASSNKYSAVQLPYGNGTFVMDVVLPNEGVSTSELLGSLNWSGIDYNEEFVNLNFVKFKAKNRSLLKDLLGNLGFDDLMGASYNEISEGLKLSEIQQNTYIEVDAFGTKAAAVSTASFNKAVPSVKEPVQVDVNRPFLFAIRELATGQILFMGDVEQVENFVEQ